MKQIRSYVDHTVLVRALSSVSVSNLGSQDGSPKGCIRNGGGRYRQELRHPLVTAHLLGTHLVATESTVDFIDCVWCFHTVVMRLHVNHPWWYGSDVLTDSGRGVGAFPRYVSVVLDRAIGVRSVAL
eukprot:6492377-Amphidinium_carterae.3